MVLHTQIACLLFAKLFFTILFCRKFLYCSALQVKQSNSYSKEEKMALNLLIQIKNIQQYGRK
jgi:hypothetical protein